MTSALTAFVVALWLFLPTPSFGWYILLCTVTSVFVFSGEKLLRVFHKVSRLKRAGSLALLFFFVAVTLATTSLVRGVNNLVTWCPKPEILYQHIFTQHLAGNALRLCAGFGSLPQG
ncbi:MAG: hypothetical protein COV91_05345 [Candidatus Taylorbacteria bacterium CG11_big_fil_rev_8_21_14_0_20_46_11]|uniref:Uncharacterized protein n=1 Tax=Candidatus Taylorbacteria bacterium CG11_big_fil_rev_8_21_14_0_20_46_11 TaxID=1975025 RepID=A0A2H0KAB3_9BACT|nr:MAG: hypothetical protein COV91_05345 [Candidatus Taylorbacteria bacterium CG11_big_fil_rev_8_21_14_0_20_46_11]